VSLAVKAGRRTVEISRPDKVLFPPDIDKADLANYYEAVSGAMLPHLAGRPLNYERFPDGIDGQRIFQQHASSHFPDWIRRVSVPARNGTVEHVVAADAAALVYLAGQACITLHRWLSRSDSLDRPDVFVVDLDPSVHEPAEVRRAALTFGALLRELGLHPWAMTTGSRGYHVVVPLQRRVDYDGVRAFARDLAKLAAAREPETFTNEQRKAKREDKILIDMQRNAYAHTAVAPYSVRPRPHAPVATPLHWDELEDASTVADRWTISSMAKRLERDGDPWHDIAKHAQTLTTARKRLAELAAEAGVSL
jgi:bifunctional non-homologous end joining protein LigD